MRGFVCVSSLLFAGTAALAAGPSDIRACSMVPGLGHCTNRDDSQRFGQYGETPGRGDPERDVLAALERWVESGIAPEHLIASTAREGQVIEPQTVRRFDTGSMIRQSAPR
jgi:feruloyl esterase